MCVVSNIGDQFADKWRPQPQPYTPYPQPLLPVLPALVTKEEFDALKKEVENLKVLLKLAKAIDAATGQPDCEMDEKIEFIKKAAELVGVDLDGIFR